MYPSLPELLSQEKEAQADAEPQSSGPSEREVALEETLSTLQQEKEAVMAQYQSQVHMSWTNALNHSPV